MSSEIIEFFFDFQLNLKMYHWSTTSYARHKASDQLGTELSKNIDRFVEIYIGRYQRPKLTKKQIISYTIMTDKDIIAYIKSKRDYLEKIDLKTDLATIRDDIIENIDQTLYLFTLE